MKGYVEHRLFGGQVDFGDPLVLQMLGEPAAQETILGVLRQAVDGLTLVGAQAVGDPKPLRLSPTRPFLWSRETAVADKSIFAAQPCDSGLEVRMCGFLDRCPDVEAFAKLAPEVRFSLEYRAEGGRLAYYYPDFVVRMTTGEHLVLETKGMADLDVPHKDERASRWAVDATVETGTRWRYLRVDEDVFDRYGSGLTTLGGLIDLVYEVRRQAYRESRPAPRQRSREEVVAALARIRQKTRGVGGVDDEIRRYRDDPSD